MADPIGLGIVPPDMLGLLMERKFASLYGAVKEITRVNPGTEPPVYRVGIVRKGFSEVSLRTNLRAIPAEAFGQWMIGKPFKFALEWNMIVDFEELTEL